MLKERGFMFDFIENYLENELTPGIYEICGEDLFSKIMEVLRYDEKRKRNLK